MGAVCHFQSCGSSALLTLPAATTLDLCHVQEVECLANGVAQSQSLRELNLAFTPLGHHASQWVGMCIKEAPGLQDINLDFTNVGASMRPLVEGVSGSKTLTQLSLKGNQLGDAGTEALASAITKSSIRSVSLYDNNIQQTGAEALGLAICMAPQLQVSLSSTAL